MQKEVRLQNTQDLLHRAQREKRPFLHRIVTGDESWLYCYDPETKQQSSQWVALGEQRPQKARQLRFTGKVMVVVFFDAEGVLYHRYLGVGETITADLYTDILKSLVDAVRRKRPDLRNQGWMLLHDNARPHTAKVVGEFLHRNNIDVLPHPPYSPDLAPCDFWLFSHLKKPLRGRQFSSVNELMHASNEVLRNISKDGLLFVFEKWRDRLQSCIQAGGSYFE